MATYFGLSLDHLQANVLKYEVQSVRTMYRGIPYYLQGVRKTNEEYESSCKV